jgi:hypothetical protein
MKAILLKEDEDFSCTVYGWKLNTPPPSIAASGNFQSTPTVPEQIQKANFQILPRQTINISNPNAQNISLTNSTAWSENTNFWVLGGAEPISGESAYGALTFNLNMIIPADVTFEMTVAAVNVPGKGPVSSGFQILVNGTQLVLQQSENDHWHILKFGIPGQNLNQGPNTIEIRGEYEQGLWVKSITVFTTEAKLTANYFWQQICASEVYPGDTYRHSVQYEQGNVSSIATTNTFAESLGITIKIGGIEKLLLGLSVQLSASFTATQSTTHTISISSSTTKTTQVTISCPSGSKSNTFQVWQLCLQYEAGGKSMVQALGANLAPIIYKQYLQPS